MKISSFSFLKLKALLEVPYPITVVMMFIAYLVSFTMNYARFDFFYTIFGFVLMFSFIGAFNTLNGIFDIEGDKISKSTRPLPSGRLTLNEAKSYSIFLYVVTVTLFYLFFEFEIFIFSLIFVFLSLAYSLPPLRLKRVLLISDLIIALTYSIFPLIIGWTIVNTLNPIPWSEFSLIFLFGLMVLFCKNFEDFEADKNQKIMTFPTVFGLKKSLYLASFLLFLFYSFVIYYIAASILNPLYFLLFIPLPFLIYLFINFSRKLTPKSAFSFFIGLTFLMALVEIFILFLYLYTLRG